jgi:chaperone modulatory protein CbpM
MVAAGGVIVRFTHYCSRPGLAGVTWHEGARCVRQADLARAAGVSRDDLGELVDYGLVPAAGDEKDPIFAADCVPPLREAARLRRLYDLDVFTMGLLYGFLQRLQSTESELRFVRDRLQDPCAG